MIEVNKFELSNGLKVIHSRDNTTQMVALDLLYKVGARDEDEQHTGFAHLFEHLMFGGSVNIPDYDIPVQEAGGENNASTNNDYTNYYVTVPCQNVETGFWLESDRMLSLDFSEKSLEVQRQVVSEEFKQRYLNQPYGDTSHLIRQMAYKEHPYRWPTIGLDINHITKASMDDVKDFFYRFYAPNNCILAVTGNISFEETCRLTRKWFENIPRREVKRSFLRKEPVQVEERRLDVTRNVPVDAIYMAFHMCDRMHPDYYACDILSDLLCNGRSSRLVQHLVQEQRSFGSIDAYIAGSVDPGLFFIVGKLSKGILMQTAEQSIWNELETLKTELVNDEELEKVKNRFESEQIFNNTNYLNVATNLAYFEMLDQAEDINLEVPKYRAVTREQVRDVANRVFIKTNNCTLYYRSNNV